MIGIGSKSGCVVIDCETFCKGKPSMFTSTANWLAHFEEEARWAERLGFRFDDDLRTYRLRNSGRRFLVRVK